MFIESINDDWRCLLWWWGVLADARWFMSHRFHRFHRFLQLSLLIMSHRKHGNHGKASSCDEVLWSHRLHGWHRRVVVGVDRGEAGEGVEAPATGREGGAYVDRILGASIGRGDFEFGNHATEGGSDVNVVVGVGDVDSLSGGEGLAGRRQEG